MPNFQKYIFIGHLTKDPDLRGLPNGSSVCALNVAINEGYGDKESTFFFMVKVFGKTADFCKKYLAKGSCIIGEGRWARDEYTDKSGQKQSKSYVIASSVSFGESRGGGNSQARRETRTPDYDKWAERPQRDVVADYAQQQQQSVMRSSLPIPPPPLDDDMPI